jgi:hypothetical protein
MNSNSSNQSSVSSQLSAETISRRAYEIWEQQGRPDGNDLQHWLQAEQELSGGSATTSAVSAASTAQKSEPAADTRPLQGTRGATTKRASGTPFGTEKVPVSNGRQTAGASRR